MLLNSTGFSTQSLGLSAITAGVVVHSGRKLCLNVNIKGSWTFLRLVSMAVKDMLIDVVMMMMVSLSILTENNRFLLLDRHA